MKHLLLVVLILSVSFTQCFNAFFGNTLKSQRLFGNPSRSRELEQSTTCPPDPVCSANIGQACGTVNGVLTLCKAGTVCSNYNFSVSPPTGTCSQPGSIGQNCANLLDCLNTTTSTSCQGGKCLESHFLGVGETCTDNYTCITDLCIGGKCNQSANGCLDTVYCPFNNYCDKTTLVNFVYGTCAPVKAIGASCVDTEECGFNNCINKKCAAPYSQAENQPCLYESDCSSCTGCDAKNSTTPGVCTKTLTKVTTYSTACVNDTDCIGVGVESCECEKSSNTQKCVTAHPVITTQDCKSSFDALASCLTTNQCPPLFTGFETTITVIGNVAAGACINKCRAQADCMGKCAIDLVKTNFASSLPSIFNCITSPPCTAGVPAGTCYGGGGGGNNGSGSSLTVTLLLVLLVVLVVL
jgi:hypothetical protein